MPFLPRVIVKTGHPVWAHPTSPKYRDGIIELSQLNYKSHNRGVECPLLSVSDPAQGRSAEICLSSVLDKQPWVG